MRPTFCHLARLGRGAVAVVRPWNAEVPLGLPERVEVADSRPEAVALAAAGPAARRRPPRFSSWRPAGEQGPDRRARPHGLGAPSSGVTVEPPGRVAYS